MRGVGFLECISCPLFDPEGSCLNDAFAADFRASHLFGSVGGWIWIQWLATMRGGRLYRNGR